MTELLAYIGTVVSITVGLSAVTPKALRHAKRGLIWWMRPEWLRDISSARSEHEAAMHE